MPRSSSLSFSLMPSCSSCMAKECLRLTIHWKCSALSGLAEISRGTVAAVALTATLVEVRLAVRRRAGLRARVRLRARQGSGEAEGLYQCDFITVSSLT